MRFDPTKKNKGFTLIEMLVVLLITVMLSGILITYSDMSEKKFLLTSQQAKVLGAILKAKNSAMEAFREQGKIPCGYGFMITKKDNSINILNRVIVFKKLRPVNQTNCPSNPPSYKYLNDTSEIFKIIDLENGIQFTSATDQRQIFFQPPEPKVFFEGQPAELWDKVVIEITTTIPSSVSAKINVTGVGQITTK